MKIKAEKILLGSFTFIATHPIILMPFIFIAFFETLFLEIAYFSVRPPLSSISGPIIKKLFGETFLHYPGDLALLPKLFYFGQMVSYVVVGVFLTTIAIQVLKNIREKLPLKIKALLKNSLKRYPAYFMYGLVIIGLSLVLQRLSFYFFLYGGKALAKLSFHINPQMNSVFLTIFFFLANIFLQVFFILTVPIIVIEKLSFLKALARSASLGFRNFLTIGTLILIPSLVYLPIMVLKNFSGVLVDKIFPEINLYIIFLGIAASIFIDCFIVTSVTQFLLDKAEVGDLGT